MSTPLFVPVLALSSGHMKEVDVSRCVLVHAGQSWEHDQQPCSKEMIPFLERRENYCSWFQPIGGTVDDQFPAMRIKSKYYLLSLRVQKAIFRHVRLRRGFVNREYVPDGRVKLRIPQPLLLEKRRTAKRFMVSVQACLFITSLNAHDFLQCPLHYIQCLTLRL